MGHTHTLQDETNSPRPFDTIAPDLLSNLSYGLGMLAFLLWPMLIPETGFQLAVLESSAIAMAGYLAICLYGIYACLRDSTRRTAAMGRRDQRTNRRRKLD